MNDACKSGAFRWNAGGWFGGQLGTTAYVLLIGSIVLVDSPRDGIPILLCGLIPNLFGLYLWHLRARLSPYTGIQALMLGTFACALVFAGLIVWFVTPQTAQRYFSGVEKALWVLAFFPLMMLHFRNLHRRSMKQPQHPAAPYSEPAARSPQG